MTEREYQSIKLGNNHQSDGGSLGKMRLDNCASLRSGLRS